MNTIIRAKDISKVFVNNEIENRVINDISLEIYHDEIVVILGPSGSGKSTLLNILGGIEPVTGGEIYFKGTHLHGKNFARLTDYRRDNVGFVFQFYNLLSGLTALENVMLGGQLSPAPLDASELLDKVGLADKKDSYPSKMSGGQQQRVAIARALCKNPDLLLCDEPTGALDGKTGVAVLQLLWEFHRDHQKTILIITHNPTIAEIADRVIYLRDGEVERIVKNEHPLAPEEVEW